MKWYVAPALETLRRQLNEAYPNRSKASDGGIGDGAHSNRNSDHNPHVRDAQGKGVVTARDFTHDPANGLDCNELARQLIASRDPRIKYIIWNRQICSSYGKEAWQWRPYKGTNAHNHHLHLSVSDAPAKYNDTGAWLSTAVSNQPSTTTVNSSSPSDPQLSPSNTYTVQSGDTLWRIAGLFHTTVSALKQANPNIADPDVVQVGTVLRVKL